MEVNTRSDMEPRRILVWTPNRWDPSPERKTHEIAWGGWHVGREALRTSVITRSVRLACLIGVQVLVERDAATVAGNHLDCAGHRIAAEQHVAAAGELAGLD